MSKTIRENIANLIEYSSSKSNSTAYVQNHVGLLSTSNRNVCKEISTLIIAIAT